MTARRTDMGSRLRAELDFDPGFVRTTGERGDMSEKQPESYEAPSVEEIEIDGKPIAIASEVAASA
jgi:hypothetical protein